MSEEKTPYQTLVTLYQPNPTEGKTVVADQVITDIKERVEFGVRKYGGPLMTNNGRNALWDAYQEALDLVMYLRQRLLEDEGK